MKCQNLISGKNTKNISKYRPLKISPRVLSFREKVCKVGPVFQLEGEGKKIQRAVQVIGQVDLYVNA